jgi:DNA-binding IclR family transcriptional regulator
MPQVPAIKRALAVLELLVHEREPLTLADIAERTGIPTASAHAIMHTLLDEGYVSRRVEGRGQRWEPTLAVYHLGSTLITRYGIRDIARPHLRELSQELGLPAHLGVLVGTDVMYLEKAAVDESFIQFNTFPGKLSPYDLTALGRAIVAHLPAEEREPLMTATDPGFDRLLARVRAEGFATEDSDDIDGVGCIAAPVFGLDGRVIGSVGITGFSRDLFADPAVPAAAQVVDAARAISGELGHQPAAAAAAR